LIYGAQMKQFIAEAYIGARVPAEMRKRYLALGGKRWLCAQLADPDAKPVARTARNMDYERMVAMYAAGEKLDYIAAVCSCSRQTIIAAVDRAGIPRRPKGRKPKGAV
jgi:hypothetical protein